jgi:hypothetical protein|tara:strand:+ start:159 stop:356 length:198 start_codon:yes stop_codon:yes gene_type:complete
MGNAIYNEVKKNQRHKNKIAKEEIIEQEELPLEQEDFPIYILWILGLIPITTLVCCYLCISCKRR